MKAIYSFSLDRDAAEIIDQTPKYKPKVNKGKSALVSDSIIKYHNNVPLNLRGQAHYENIIKRYVAQVTELQLENRKLALQVGGRSIIQRFLGSLFRPFRPRKQG